MHVSIPNIISSVDFTKEPHSGIYISTKMWFHLKWFQRYMVPKTEPTVLHLMPTHRSLHSTVDQNEEVVILMMIKIIMCLLLISGSFLYEECKEKLTIDDSLHILYMDLMMLILFSNSVL